MATVVLAEDTLLGREVALKRMIGAADPRGLLRLRREALAGASLSHHNLVSIYDVVTSEEGDLVIVMEYVRGETLRDALSRQGKLPVPEALRILEGVAAGLDTIHRQGIVHRDVKPPNILLGTDGTVKVADLGVASVPDRTKITSAGAVVGSFSYMAPEQLEDAPSTPAIDVYALAAVAFEALAGIKARGEANPVALAHAISTQPPPDIRDAWPEAPRPVAELLNRAMSRDPAQRPRSAGELIGRLRSALEPMNTAPIAVPSPPAGRGRTALTRPMPGRAEQDGKRAAAAGAGAAGAAAAVAADRQERGAGQAARHGAATPGSARRDGERALAAHGAWDRRAVPRGLSPRANEPRESRRRFLLAALLALVAAAVLLAVLLNSGGSPKPRTQNRAAARPRTPASHTTTTHTPRTATAESGSTAAPAAGSAQTSTSSSAPAASPAPQSAGSPVSSVETFYELAASHRYAQAWALADPAFQSQLGGYQSFQSGQQGDRSITFDSAQLVSRSGSSATVAIRTTSVRTDGTHQCGGTVDLSRGSSAQWLLHQIHINCT